MQCTALQHNKRLVLGEHPALSELEIKYPRLGLSFIGYVIFRDESAFKHHGGRFCSCSFCSNPCAQGGDKTPSVNESCPMTNSAATGWEELRTRRGAVAAHARADKPSAIVAETVELVIRR